MDAKRLFEVLGIIDGAHSGRSLSDHLLGTAALLDEWGARPDLVVAGLVHSIYGTDSYPIESVPLSDRTRIRGVIGETSEEIVFLFCVMDRSKFYADSMQGSAPASVEDRYSGNNLDLSAQRSSDLAELIVANWLEQSTPRPLSDPSSVPRELRAMLPFLTNKTREAVSQDFGF